MTQLPNRVYVVLLAVAMPTVVWLFCLSVLGTMLLATVILTPPLDWIFGADMDGFKLRLPRVRLYGIDALESGQTCDDASGKRYLCGTRAADYLAELIGRSDRVKCFEEDRDRYGRIVAECAVNGSTVVNAEMVRAGWAIEYREYSDGRYDREEAEAKAARRGL